MNTTTTTSYYDYSSKDQDPSLTLNPHQIFLFENLNNHHKQPADIVDKLKTHQRHHSPIIQPLLPRYKLVPKYLWQQNSPCSPEQVAILTRQYLSNNKERAYVVALLEYGRSNNRIQGVQALGNDV